MFFFGFCDTFNIDFISFSQTGHPFLEGQTAFGLFDNVRKMKSDCIRLPASIAGRSAFLIAADN